MVPIHTNSKSILNFVVKFSMLLILFLGSQQVLSKTIQEVDAGFDPQYEACVARVLRHPLRMGEKLNHNRGWNQFESDSTLLNDTDKICHCIGKLDRAEKTRSQDQSLAYFFSGRSEYFSQVDSCLLGESSEKNYALFSAIFTYDQIIPLVEVHLKDLDPPSVTMVRGRYPAQEMQFCMVEKVMEECQKIRSLYFTYKCLKKKIKNMDFYNDIKSQCRGDGQFSLGEGQKI